MSEQTMVERVARAMFAKTGGLMITHGDWDKLGEQARKIWVQFALAALAALREPTEAMTMAYGEPFNEADARRNEASWQAMIDAALSEAS